jgi:hypothetical protein
MVVVPVGAGETRVLRDVLSYFTDDADGGALLITALDGEGLYVAARRTGARGPGLALPVLSPAGARVDAVTFLRDASSLGVVETGGAAARARVSLLAPDGTLLASEDVTLAPGASLEWAGLAGPLAGLEGTALIETLEGSVGSWRASR